MRDGCWVPGCKGEIQPNRDLRSTVARGGDCTVCGARYKRFGSGEWKFETERAICQADGCDGDMEFDLVPERDSEAACWKCETRYVRQSDGTVTLSKEDA